MTNIFDMIARVDLLNEIRENEIAKAAVQLQAEIDAFVAHYGYAYTGRCPITGHTYALLRDGLILRKKEDDNDDEGETVTIKDISLEEMEFLRGFMVECIHYDSKYIEDDIDRYIDLCQ